MTGSASLTRASFSDEGFTLIEMLVVLGIVALIASFGLPYLLHRADPSVQRLARHLAAELRQERALAVAQAAPRLVTFDVGNASITFESGDVISIPRTIALTITTGDKTIVEQDRAVLTFLPNGSASGVAIKLAAKSGTREIEVHWLTGLVRESVPSDAM